MVMSASVAAAAHGLRVVMLYERALMGLVGV